MARIVRPHRWDKEGKCSECGKTKALYTEPENCTVMKLFGALPDKELEAGCRMAAREAVVDLIERKDFRFKESR